MEEATSAAVQGAQGSATLSGAWAPLRVPTFRWLWIAAVVSNIGTWFQEVAAGWLMTSLSSSPLMVSLVQAATTLPMLLLALPAGAFADIVDRRRLLLGMTVWMSLVAGLMAGLQEGGVLGAWGLLALLFAVSIGAAMAGPAWQAIVPELVSRPQIGAAVALNSVGINIARAIGPVLAGLAVALAGPGVAFAINALSFVAVATVLARWRRPATPSELPAEHFLPAIASGLRYVRHSPSFVAVLVRTITFAFPAVALWALLPLAARELLGAGASGYGLLLGSIGIGAVLGALVLPPLRQRWSPETLALLATVTYAGGIGLLALAPPLPVAALLMVPVGLAWMTMVTTLIAGAQYLLPDWVRARGMSVHMMALFGGLALGAVVWGTLAGAAGLPATFLTAAGSAAVAAAAALRFKLPAGEGPDLTPSRHWPTPGGPRDDGPERGPVLVTIEYTIPDEARGCFLRDACQVRRIRLRDGALSWQLYEDPSQRGRFVETFVNRTWTDHLRMHDRVTIDDLDAEALFRRHHRGPNAPQVTHLISSRSELPEA